MAEENASADEKTEEATPQRREEAREKGQIATSKELSSVAVLAAAVAFIAAYVPHYVVQIQRLMVTTFESAATRRIDRTNILSFAMETWEKVLLITIPVFVVTLVAAGGTTFLQTRFSWSWKKLEPDFKRMNPLQGLQRMVASQAWVELLKGIGKLLAVGVVAWLILRREVLHVPELMSYPVMASWKYWGGITERLFWAVSGLLLLIGGADYGWNWYSNEKQLKMTKDQVKREYKNQEGDPLMKRRRERFGRELLSRKTLEKTKEATVLITNPTHFSIALKYEIGMDAPILVAKGVDHLALKMREIAKDKKIPIIENRPLARELYATVEEGEAIPSKLYKAVAEIIRYVYRLKGRALQPRSTTTRS